MVEVTDNGKHSSLVRCVIHNDNKIQFQGGNKLGMNEGRSAASFCHQVALMVPDMSSNFYLAKNSEIAND